MKLLREAQGVLYEVFDIHALDDMAVVIAKAFAGYQPMAVIQGVSREELVDFVKLFGPKAAKEELSLVARDRETGQVVVRCSLTTLRRHLQKGSNIPARRLAPSWGYWMNPTPNTSRGKACAWGIICTCS